MRVTTCNTVQHRRMQHIICLRHTGTFPMCLKIKNRPTDSTAVTVFPMLDEAKWGLDWLLKMHPKDDWLFNQLGDDRDHRGMRIPKEDTNFCGRGLEPAGVSQTASHRLEVSLWMSQQAWRPPPANSAAHLRWALKYFSPVIRHIPTCFQINHWALYSLVLRNLALHKRRRYARPIFYAEDNWVDDMELALTEEGRISTGKHFTRTIFNFSLRMQKWTSNTMAWQRHSEHYQWYPFINVGHYELAKQLTSSKRDTLIAFYKEGIERVRGRQCVLPGHSIYLVQQ